MHEDNINIKEYNLPKSVWKEEIELMSERLLDKPKKKWKTGKK